VVNLSVHMPRSADEGAVSLTLWQVQIDADGCSLSMFCRPRWSRPRHVPGVHPDSRSAISAAAAQDDGLASVIVNTGYQVGSALGLAVIRAVASAAGAGQAGDFASLTDGHSAAFVAAAVVAGAGAVLSAVLLCSDREQPKAPTQLPGAFARLGHAVADSSSG